MTFLVIFVNTLPFVIVSIFGGATPLITIVVGAPYCPCLLLLLLQCVWNIVVLNPSLLNPLTPNRLRVYECIFFVCPWAAYALFGINEVGIQLEDPFGYGSLFCVLVCRLVCHFGLSRIFFFLYVCVFRVRTDACFPVSIPFLTFPRLSASVRFRLQD